jgi:hypothetical protein
VFAQGSLPQIIGKINRPVKSGKDHIFTFAGLLKYEWFICNDIESFNVGKGKNVANTRTLSAIETRFYWNFTRRVHAAQME